MASFRSSTRRWLPRNPAKSLERHLPDGQEIAFLSVDVEGHDFAVLASNDGTIPKLIVVEEEQVKLTRLNDHSNDKESWLWDVCSECHCSRQD